MLFASVMTSGAARGESPREIGNRISAYQRKGDFSKAMAEAKVLEAHVRRRVGTHNLSYAIALSYLGQCSLDLARYSEAEEYYRRAATMAEQLHDPFQVTLNGEVADTLRKRGRFMEAEGAARKAVATGERMLGSQHEDTVRVTRQLADILHDESRDIEAEPLYRRVLVLEEKRTGANSSETGATVAGLGISLLGQARFREAEPMMRRALAISEALYGPDHPDAGILLINLGTTLEQQGRVAEAEPLYRRSLANREKGLGPRHPDVGQSLMMLGSSLHLQNRHAEAESLFRRSLDIREAALGPDHADVARSLSNLGSALQWQGKNVEAEAMHRRALAIRERVYGLTAPDVAISLSNLAGALTNQDRIEESEPLVRRALAIREAALGPSHPQVGVALNDLAYLLEREGKPREARDLYLKALAIREGALGPQHPNTIATLRNLARVSDGMGDIGGALVWSRRAVAAVLAEPEQAQSETVSGVMQPDRAEVQADFLGRQVTTFYEHVRLLGRAAEAGLEPAPTLAAEAFETCQRTGNSRASAALRQTSIRFAAGSDRLAELTRRLQDLTAQRTELNQRLVAAIAKGTAEIAAETGRLRQALAQAEAEIATGTETLRREFPRYAELTRPRPITVADAQRLLDPDEAMVVLLTGTPDSFVFAITREGVSWRKLPLDAEAISEKVAAFRRGLDLVEFQRSGSDPAARFDLGRAHALYETLLGPVAGTIAGKHGLVFVPTGALTALPFHLLVTEAPAIPERQAPRMTDYRDAAWLIRGHAVSVLPSVNSLDALRATPRGASAPSTMIGFGDPVFSRADAPPMVASARGGGEAPRATRAGYSDFWRGAGIDRERLSQALPQLPETADELNAISHRLKVSASDVFLGEQATERAVKQAPLSNYRIVYFATHGLVAGDIKGIGEPSLALTLPRQPSETDDGLLTASEVAALHLNADWVVLSACNTIAGDRPGAEALSGLVRAFFYAGARALLVTHWSAGSEAATRLTTSTFTLLEAQPSLGRAEALRRAMLDYIAQAARPLDAYPAFWAPFAVIGEGGAR
ncbi:hypothetical protein GCM10007884_49540 [Methylobacterium brachythecii]|nr:hypothetical protein GCM10007884_49540 [Methylobacterium brachythecii]